MVNYPHWKSFEGYGLRVNEYASHKLQFIPEALASAHVVHSLVGKHHFDISYLSELRSMARSIRWLSQTRIVMPTILRILRLKAFHNEDVWSLTPSELRSECMM